jgi:hypothetical protein
VRGVWFAWLDHIGIRYRRKRHIARIFDRRRRRIGNRNIGLWRQRRYLYWRNARLGRGRSGNLVRLVGFKLFQNQYPMRAAYGVVWGWWWSKRSLAHRVPGTTHRGTDNNQPGSRKSSKACEQNELMGVKVRRRLTKGCRVQDEGTPRRQPEGSGAYERALTR